MQYEQPLGLLLIKEPDGTILRIRMTTLRIARYAAHFIHAPFVAFAVRRDA